MNSEAKLPFYLTWLTLIDIIVGFILSNSFLNYILVIHVVLGLILFFASIMVYSNARFPIIKRMSLGNAIIIALNGLLGVGFVLISSSLYSIVVPYIHLALALGVLSNFAYMSGYLSKQ
ncbi:hypothetical protein HS7_05670 [Sulfolobales archaeon HS-7]|nr:hypothetical protein HS7_05670 [Sulfolobales archaeon HS-7]